MTISEKGDIKREETLLADDEHSDDAREDDQLIKQEPEDDSRFQQPAPAPWKRVVLLVFLAGMFWLAYSLRKASWERKNKVVYANRYSEDFKFRPAASPVVTETLRGGGKKIRGANVTSAPIPTPTVPVEEKIKRRRSKRLANKKKLSRTKRT